MKYKVVVVVLFYVTLIVFAKNMWSMDMNDRTHPYGLDMTRNEKFCKGVEGEKYGVSVYWGRPGRKDKPVDMLNKIEWLANSHKREVFWRRSLVSAIVLVPILLLISGYENFLNPLKVVACLPLAFVLFYFTYVYAHHHVEHYRSMYTNSHIRKLKTKLKLPSYNPIYKKI